MAQWVYDGVKDPRGTCFHPRFTLQRLQRQQECGKSRGEGRLGSAASRLCRSMLADSLLPHTSALGLGPGVSRGGATRGGRRRSIMAGPASGQQMAGCILTPASPSRGRLGLTTSGLGPAHTGSWDSDGFCGPEELSFPSTACAVDPKASPRSVSQRFTRQP